jgi:hypothetical protein
MNMKTIRALFFVIVTLLAGHAIGLLTVRLLAGEKPRCAVSTSSSVAIDASLVDRLEFRMSLDRVIEILGDPEGIIEKRRTPSNDNAEKKRLCYTLTDGSHYVVIINRHDELVAGGVTAPVIANR